MRRVVVAALLLVVGWLNIAVAAAVTYAAGPLVGGFLGGIALGMAVVIAALAYRPGWPGAVALLGIGGTVLAGMVGLLSGELASEQHWLRRAAPAGVALSEVPRAHGTPLLRVDGVSVDVPRLRSSGHEHTDSESSDFPEHAVVPLRDRDGAAVEGVYAVCRDVRPGYHERERCLARWSSQPLRGLVLVRPETGACYRPLASADATFVEVVPSVEAHLAERAEAYQRFVGGFLATHAVIVALWLVISAVRARGPRP